MSWCIGSSGPDTPPRGRRSVAPETARVTEGGRRRNPRLCAVLPSTRRRRVPSAIRTSVHVITLQRPWESTQLDSAYQTTQRRFGKLLTEEPLMVSQPVYGAIGGSIVVFTSMSHCRQCGRIKPPAPLPRPTPLTGPTPDYQKPVEPPTPQEPEGDTSIDEVDRPEEVENLKFKELKLMRKTNRPRHKTERYHNKGLIVRRGWGFKVKVILSDTYHKESDLITLKFLKSSTPKFSNGTCVVLRSDQSEKSFMNRGWTLDVTDMDDKEVTLEITPDVDAPVGQFSIVVETQRKKSDDDIQVSRKVATAEFIVLFNAFHKDDDVYMEDEAEREEYVMKDTGIIYTSVRYAQDYPSGRRNWNYGQFEESVLEAALWILDNGYLKKHLFGNVVHVTRALSAEVNDKVLTGNWSGKYLGGRRPTDWNGSEKILQQFYKSKSSVKFGQCWVFSGVLTTVTRALGAGCRSVTNNSSGHDKDASSTIDHYVDADNEPIKGRNRDSVWNFHVWNECWMRRHDLPSGYDGWQAFDSTPQEASFGKYRCGPAPVKAIYQGQVDIKYDAPFIFSEVNADRVYWKVDNDEPSVYSIKTNVVGKLISTKQVGSDKREDVTNKYKPPEGSGEERTNAINAMRRGKTWKLMVKDFEKYKEHQLGVTFDVQDKIDAHGDCHSHVKITNNTAEERTVIGKMNMLASYNVWSAREKLHDPFNVNLKLAAGKSKTVKWDVPAEEYFSKLDDDAMVQICAAFSIKDSDQTWSCVENVPLEKPDMEVTVDKEEVEIGEEFTVTVSFTNPFNVAIHDVDVDLEGPGMKKESMDLNVKKVLGPKETLTTSVKLKAARPGHKAIIASFDGKELQGISGATTIKIKGEEVMED